MAVVIRLTRKGKRGAPHYRVVAAEKSRRRDGVNLEKIGTYNPQLTDKPVKIDKNKLDKWISNGAQLSFGVQKLLKQKNIYG